MYCLVSKMIVLDPSMHMIIFRVKKFGHDSLRTTQRVLEEEPKDGKTLPWQCQSMPSIDASCIANGPSIRGVDQQLGVVYKPPKVILIYQ